MWIILVDGVGDVQIYIFTVIRREILVFRIKTEKFHYAMTKEAHNGNI